MSAEAFPNTLTPSQEMRQPWGKLVSCFSNLDSVVLEKQSVKIGRAVICDIVIDKNKLLSNDTSISKEHCMLTKEPDDKNVYITDLSKNGTFLNGVKIGRNNRKILKDYDKIAIVKDANVYVFQSISSEDLPDTTTSPSSLEPSLPMKVNIPIWGRLVSCLLHLDSVDMCNVIFKVGRSSQCDVVIDSMKIDPVIKKRFSKEHFIIYNNPDNAIPVITDLSKSGTYLNGRLIGKNKRNILQHDDTISIGPKRTRVYVYKSMSPSDTKYLPSQLRNKYEVSGLLGKGACGEVRLAYEKCTCKMYAIKRILKGRSTTSQMYKLNHPSKIENEVKILESLSHGWVSPPSWAIGFLYSTYKVLPLCQILASYKNPPLAKILSLATVVRAVLQCYACLEIEFQPFIIQMKEIVETQDEMFIVLEYMKGGELSNRILSNVPLTESNVKFLFYQMVQAVQYLHMKGITHRDLKPENVLLFSDDTETTIKVSDFGLSKIVEEDDMMKTQCGTLNYIAPEVLDGRIEKYDKQVDVWSLGVILFYMLTKELPFKSTDKKKLGRCILSGEYIMDNSSWSGISHMARDLVRKMLKVKPQERITISAVLMHPWLAQDVAMQYRVKTLLDNRENSDTSEDFEDPYQKSPPSKRIRLSSDESE